MIFQTPTELQEKNICKTFTLFDYNISQIKLNKFNRFNKVFKNIYLSKLRDWNLLSMLYIAFIQLLNCY